MIAQIDPIVFWLFFSLIASFIIFFDIFIVEKVKKQDLSILTFLITVVLACVFAAMIFINFGIKDCTDFITAYLLELSLSIDNIFVMILIFNSLKIDQKYQNKVLIIGVVSAILMRMIMISFSVYITERFSWTFYLFGLILIITGFENFYKIRKRNRF